MMVAASVGEETAAAVESGGAVSPGAAALDTVATATGAVAAAAGSTVGATIAAENARRPRTPTVATRARTEPPRPTQGRPCFFAMRQCALVGSACTLVRSSTSCVAIVDSSPFAQPTIRWFTACAPIRFHGRHPRLDGTRQPKFSIEERLPRVGLHSGAFQLHRRRHCGRNRPRRFKAAVQGDPAVAARGDT